MFLVHLTRAEDISLDPLENGPGLLPFKLGATKIISHHHSFLLYINLADIQSKVDLVKLQFKEFNPLVNNRTSTIFEPHLNYLENKLEKISLQLESFEPSRNKRGLIDGLGSVIKSISGNLDYTDALKYNDAIRVLQGNEDKLQSEFLNRVSLTKDWMFEYTNILNKIDENQKLISSKINSLINQGNTRQADLVSYAHLAQYFLILNDNVETLSDELYRIELMLAFIRASSTMHSMVSLINLKTMLSKLKLIYSKDEIIDLDLRNYYNILKVGSYYSDRNIVIVIKFPIALPRTYTLYKLSIVPNKYNLALMPTLPYIAIQGPYSTYIETECPKIDSWYLCEEKANYNIQDKPDCVQQLITQQNTSSCTLTPVSLNKEAMEKLDEMHYTLSFPIPTKIQTTCRQEQFITIQGSYLATIPQNCFIKTPEFTISNINNRIKGHTLKIIQLPLNQNNVPKSEEPLVKLNSINLENLHSSYQKISVQPPVKLIHTNVDSIYHTTIPVYSLLFGLGALGSILMYRQYARKKVEKACPTQPEPAQEIYAQVEPRRNIRPEEVRIDANHLAATLSTSFNK